MALDPELAEANLSQGFYQFYFERRWRDAGRYFARARALNARSPLIQVYSGFFAALDGDAAEVRLRTDAAIELDPLSPFVHALSALAFYAVRDFAEAERRAARVLSLQGDYLFARWVHGLALCGLGRCDEGAADLAQATAVSRAPIFVGMLGLAYGLAGRRDDARGLLAELDDREARGEYVPVSARLNIHVGLGDVEGVRRELAGCLAEVAQPQSFRVTGGVLVDHYRSDPEVARLLDAWSWGDDPGPSP